MRKVIFKIDDKEYFRRELEKDNCNRKTGRRYSERVRKFQSNLHFVRKWKTSR